MDNPKKHYGELLEKLTMVQKGNFMVLHPEYDEAVKEVQKGLELLDDVIYIFETWKQRAGYWKIKELLNIK